MGLDLRAGRPSEDPDDYGWEWMGNLHAQWSYTGFNLFRARLAQEEGFHLDAMGGFTRYGRPWSEVSTPLEPLLNHSDCEGEMTPDQAGRVAPRLAEIVDKWRQASEFDYDVRAGAALVELLAGCAENGWTVLFS